MEKFDNNNKNSVGGGNLEGGTPSLGILRNPPPPSPLPQWSKDDAQTQRNDRYIGLAAARSILLYEGKKRFPLLPTKYHRTTLCKHAMTGSGVAVLLSEEHNKAFFDGLQTCGSVWTCPVCAAKVQERRRLEIAHGMEFFYKTGNRQAVMVTFTFPHQKHMPLIELLLKQRDAFKYLRKGNTWDKFKEKVSFEGLIRALEITYGLVNGWHPHTHELWFVDLDLDQKHFLKVVQEKWKKACIKAGLLNEEDKKQVSAFATYAVDVKFNCKASDYLAKTDHKDNLKSYWGADREIAKASSKGKKENKGMHPFQLAIDNKQDLFIEYVEAVRETVSRQLYWSRFLKKKVGLEDKSDEEVAEEETAEAEVLTMISKPEWFVIRKKEKRAQVLNCAENDKGKLRSFILGIVADNSQNE